MKMDEYKRIFDKTDTTYEMDLNTLSLIRKEKHSCKSAKLHRNIYKKIFVAIVILSLLVIPVSAGVVMTINYFEGLFGKENSEYVVDVIYSDESEHGIMRIEQAISDGKNAYLIFSYELLDERGKEWYSNYFLKYGLQRDIHIQPKIKDDNYKEYGVNWFYGVYDAKEAGIDKYETKNKKYFMATFAADSDKYGTSQIQFQYLLPGRGVLRTADIEIEKTVPNTVYEIEYREHQGKAYVPTRVTLSLFGVCIEGRDLGIRKSEEENNEDAIELNSLFLITKDRGKIDLLDIETISGGYSGVSKYENTINENEADCLIYTGCLQKTISVDNIMGISINSEEYYFK